MCFLRTSKNVCMHAKSLQSHQLFAIHRLWPTRLLCPWDSPGKNTGAGCHALLHFRAVGKESETCKRYSMLESTGVPRRVKERKNKVCGE